MAISAGTSLALCVIGLAAGFAVGTAATLASVKPRTAHVVRTGDMVVQVVAASTVLVYGLLWSVGGIAGLIAG